MTYSFELFHNNKILRTLDLLSKSLEIEVFYSNCMLEKYYFKCGKCFLARSSSIELLNIFSNSFRILNYCPSRKRVNGFLSGLESILGAPERIAFSSFDDKHSLIDLLAYEGGFEFEPDCRIRKSSYVNSNKRFIKALRCLGFTGENLYDAINGYSRAVNPQSITDALFSLRYLDNKLRHSSIRLECSYAEGGFDFIIPNKYITNFGGYFEVSLNVPLTDYHALYGLSLVNGLMRYKTADTIKVIANFLSCVDDVFK